MEYVIILLPMSWGGVCEKMLDDGQHAVMSCCGQSNEVFLVNNNIHVNNSHEPFCLDLESQWAIVNIILSMPKSGVCHKIVNVLSSG